MNHADLEQAVLGPARAAGAVAVYLHGSRACGMGRPDSDLDLAVLLPHGHDFETVAPMLAEAVAPVALMSPDDVDVQNLGQAPPLFRVRVLTEGVLLYLSDPTALARFQATSMCEHWDNEIYLAPFREAMRQRIRAGRFAS